MEVGHRRALDTLLPQLWCSKPVSQSRRKRTVQQAMERRLADIAVYQECTLTGTGRDSRQTSEEGRCGIARFRCHKEHCTYGPLTIEVFEAGMQIAQSLCEGDIRRRDARDSNLRSQDAP